MLDEVFLAPALFEPVDVPDFAAEDFDDDPPPHFLAVEPQDELFAAEPEPPEDLLPALLAEEPLEVAFFPELVAADLDELADLDPPAVADFFAVLFAEEAPDLEVEDFAVEPAFLDDEVDFDPDPPELDFDAVDLDPPVDLAEPLAEDPLAVDAPPFLLLETPAVLTTAVAVPTAAPLAAPSAAP
jgi:hypothetical protein